MNLSSLLQGISERLDVEVNMLGDIDTIVDGSVKKATFDQLISKIAENWAIETTKSIDKNL